MILRDRAPEGLLPWIREQRDIDWPEYLLYKAGRYRDGITGLSKPCADVVCTKCGEGFRASRDYSERNRRGNAAFGIGFFRDGRYTVAVSGQETVCPECGAKVTALHTSAATEREMTRYVWPMSFERAGETLICYLWRVERWTGRDGRSHYTARPWEAYLFGEKEAAVYKRWGTALYGRYVPNDAWQKLSRFADRAYDIDLIYCPEGIAEATKGTWMENSKLELYMAVEGEYRFPIAWLRLYQRRHKAETLMTCGAARLVAGMIAEEKRGKTYYQVWTQNTDVLRRLDWRKKRPAEMLRVNKQELGYFIAHEKEGLRRLTVIQEARRQGFALRVGDEDGEMSVEAQLWLVKEGILPSKVRRYFDRQKERCGQEVGVTMLKDYWRMAGQLEMELTDEGVRWPKDLRRAHDRAAERQREIKTKLRQEDFERRFERMSRYSWEKDGILIRPAHSEAELKAEGSALHHCVASYAGRHAAGETTIFFIRRTEREDESWYTLEFNEQSRTVVQNRGLRNCERTEEVKAFEAAWLAWIRAGCKRRETPQSPPQAAATAPLSGEPGKKGDRAA